MPNLSWAKKIAGKMANAAEVKALVKEPHMLFTTANPLHPTTGPQLSPFEAAKKLEEAGESVKVVRGKYGAKEPSILVSNPKNPDAIQQLAHSHGQDSVFHSTGDKNFLIQLHDNPKTGMKAGQVVEGSGKNISSKLPSDMYTQIKTKEGPVAYQGNLDFSAPPKRGIKHYGPEGITELDPSKAGSGADERKLLNSGPDKNKTTQMYNILDNKESMINGKRYIGSIPESEIYNLEQDSKKLISHSKANSDVKDWKYGRTEDAIKGQLKSEGVETFERSLGGDQKVIESFKKVPVSAVAPGAMFNNQVSNPAVEQIASKMKDGSKVLPSWEQVKAYASNPKLALSALNDKVERSVNKNIIEGTELLDKPMGIETTPEAVEAYKEKVGNIADSMNVGSVKAIDKAKDFGKVIMKTPVAQKLGTVTVANPGENIAEKIMKQRLLNQPHIKK